MSEYLNAISDSINSVHRSGDVWEHRRLEVWKVATEMDRLPESGLPKRVREMYRAWVVGNTWLVETCWTERRWRHALPSTVMEPHPSDKPFAPEGDRTSDKRRLRAYRRRVTRAADALRAGAAEEEVVHFICALDELDEALEQAGRPELDFTPDEGEPDEGVEEADRWWDK